MLECCQASLLNIIETNFLGRVVLIDKFLFNRISEPVGGIVAAMVAYLYETEREFGLGKGNSLFIRNADDEQVPTIDYFAGGKLFAADEAASAAP